MAGLLITNFSGTALQAAARSAGAQLRGLNLGMNEAGHDKLGWLLHGMGSIMLRRGMAMNAAAAPNVVVAPVPAMGPSSPAPAGPAAPAPSAGSAPTPG